MSQSSNNDKAYEASGYLTEPLVHSATQFTEITEVHRSDRNVVLKAKRYGRWWILKSAVNDENSMVNQAALNKEFEISLLLPRVGTTKVYALETIEGYGPCIVMDYIEGPTMREWLTGCHDVSQREEIALQLVDIVGRVHKLGIVHRDIKPENIIITSIGNAPVLIDFGLADTLIHTELKSPAGTQRYMSPEQFTANVPDVRNDIYSLGRVLEEMQLPSYWNSPVKKCLRPIAERVTDIDRLKLLYNRSKRLRRRIPAIIMATIIALGASLTLIMILVKAVAPATDIADNIMLRHRADSLQQSIDSLKNSSGQQIEMLNTRLDRVNDSIADDNRMQLERKEEVQKAIKAEEMVLDRIWRNTGMKYLDTVNTSGFVANAYSTEPMDREARSFVARSSTRFTPQELMLIRDALDKKIRSNYDKWTEYRLKIVSEP